MALEETSVDPTITMQLTIRSTDRSAVQVIALAVAYSNIFKLWLVFFVLLLLLLYAISYENISDHIEMKM